MSFYVERIERGVEYIEDHLDEDLALAEVARAGGLSQWHYQRVFKSITGETLKRYVRGRRMDRALDRLAETDQRVIDIALLAGFEAQESFARAFRTMFGLSPTEFRALGQRRRFLKKLKLGPEHLQHRVTGMSLEPEIGPLPEMAIVGLQTQYYGHDSDKNDLASKLPPLWQSFMGRMGEVPDAVAGTCYGAILQEASDTDRLTYWAGVEVAGAPDLDDLPPGMSRISVPGRTYARFTHRGDVTAFDHTVSYAYATWLTQSKFRLDEGPDLEIYGPGYAPNSPDSVFHYAVPVRLLG